MKIYQLYVNGHVISTMDSLEAIVSAAHANFDTPSIDHWERVNQDCWQTLGGYMIREEEVQLADQPGITWRHEGHIFFDTDSANLILFHRGKRRLLVVPEWQELMEPTKPCVQLSFKNIFKEIIAKELADEERDQELVERTKVQLAPPVIPTETGNDGKTLF